MSTDRPMVLRPRAESREPEVIADSSVERIWGSCEVAVEDGELGGDPLAESSPAVDVPDDAEEEDSHAARAWGDT